jgi:hypothetical protein
VHDETNDISLGDPILNFTMRQIVNKLFAAKAQTILRRAIREDASQSFLRRLGVPRFNTSSYMTNEIETSGSRGVGRLKQSLEQKEAFDDALRIMLTYLESATMWNRDVRGHWRLGLLRRHLETEGSAGKLKKNNRLYKSVLAYLRSKRKTDTGKGMMDRLDAIFDGIVRAIIDEQVEHQSLKRYGDLPMPSLMPAGDVGLSCEIAACTNSIAARLSECGFHHPAQILEHYRPCRLCLAELLFHR